MEYFRLHFWKIEFVDNSEKQIEICFTENIVEATSDRKPILHLPSGLVFYFASFCKTWSEFRYSNFS